MDSMELSSDELTLIERAGSLANAARRVAINFGVEELVPAESAASYPVPVNVPYGAAYKVFLFQCAPDVEQRDIVLFEPEFEVTIDAEELAVLGYQQWREPVEYDIESHLATLHSAQARELTAFHLDALEIELLDLYDQVAPAYWDDVNLEGEQLEVAARFDLLFRFLVPPTLSEYYRLLNPSFFDWLASATYVPPFTAVDKAPEASSTIIRPPRTFPQPWEPPLPPHEWGTGGDPFAPQRQAPAQEK